MAANDRIGVNEALSVFKNDNGVIDFKKVFDIPVTERLPAMYKQDLRQISAVITVALTKCFKSMNLSRPMNEEQIMDLTDAILESSSEDYLSLEDVLLFLQGLVRGKYGKLYESMDIPKFMDFFEVYREERHREHLRLKEEAHSNYKAMGDNNRLSAVDQLSSAMDRATGSLSSIKSTLK